jgi:hypothetical protein
MPDDIDISSQENIEVDSQDELLTASIEELKQEINEKIKVEENIFTSIENMAKAVGAVAGAIVASGFFFYILGYIFVSNYYASFGYRSFDLDKPAYLGAGIIFVLALTLPIVVPLVIGVLMKRYLPAKIMFRFSLLFILFFTLIYFFLEYFLLLMLTNGSYNIVFAIRDNFSFYILAHFVIAWITFQLFTYLGEKNLTSISFAMVLLLIQ